MIGDKHRAIVVDTSAITGCCWEFAATGRGRLCYFTAWETAQFPRQERVFDENTIAMLRQVPRPVLSARWPLLQAYTTPPYLAVPLSSASGQREGRI